MCLSQVIPLAGALIDLRNVRYKQSLRRLHLELCSACFVVFLLIRRRRVDKTIHYDLENIRSTAPHFIDLELASGNFIWDNDSYPSKSHSLRSLYLSYYLET